MVTLLRSWVYWVEILLRLSLWIIHHKLLDIRYGSVDICLSAISCPLSLSLSVPILLYLFMHASLSLPPLSLPPLSLFPPLSLSVYIALGMYYFLLPYLVKLSVCFVFQCTLYQPRSTIRPMSNTSLSHFVILLSL